ncbi:uncharacterized protein LOC134207475 [Armigeres subalbatus]|uniref:uncharacterized protein LOC134207475 n=1 Tax=Armigeres subalbatus TaxID=124917 RepID=UPI002ED69FE4
MIICSLAVTISVSLVYNLNYVRSSEQTPTWLSNQTVQSNIRAIFDGIDRIDVVLGDLDPQEILDVLIHRIDPQSILAGKAIRLYREVVPRGEQHRCDGERPILSAIIDMNDDDETEAKEAEMLDVIDRDYVDEFGFVEWDQTFEAFAKIWDQNHDYGYIVFVSWNAFLLSIRCLLDPYGTYLFVLSEDSSLDLDRLKDFFYSTWMHQGVFKIFFLIQEKIYAYDPFMADGPKKYGVLRELLNVEDIPSVPQRNFKGYPLRIDVFRSTYSDTIVDKNGKILDFVGADLEAGRAFTDAMNFAPTLLPPDKEGFGYKLPNGSFNGVIGRLLRRESDIAFVGFFIKDYFSRDIEFTTGIYTDELCCLVKKASRVPEYLLPITIFPGDLWGLLFVMGIICALVWILLRAGIRAKSVSGVHWNQTRRLAYLFNLSDEIRDAPLYRKMVQICVDTYILLVSGPYQRFTRSGIERLMLFGIMMVSLIFVSMFQSSLSSVFLNPVYYKDIDSLQRLDESGLQIPVKYKGFTDDVFPANYSPMMESLRDKMIFNPIKGSMLDVVAKSTKIATVTRRSTLSLDNAIFITTKQLFMIPECPRLYNLAFVVPRHSVLLEGINVFILEMLNGGLINHWIDVMNFNATLRDWKKMMGSHEENFKILTLIDMQFPFYLLAIGLILSGLIFVIELVYYRVFERSVSHHEHAETNNIINLK